MTKRNTPGWQPGRGREQLEALRELYRASDSTAPIATNTARPNVGEIVEVNGLPGRYVVTAVDDPSLITLANDQGVSLRVGERQVIRVEVPE